MTWFRFTRKGPWHAERGVIPNLMGGRVSRCWRDALWPSQVIANDPPAEEPRCKACMKRMEAAKK